MFLDLLYVLNRITTAANQWLITINRLADNYRPLKCNGCLNEENGVTGW